MTVFTFYWRHTLTIGCVCCLLAFTGCRQQQRANSIPAQSAAPYVTAQEFSERVSSAQSPVLVEFSVPTGCFRCDQMCNQLEKITTDLDGKVDVFRIDHNFDRALVAQLGIKVCPTYVAFDQGKEVFRVEFPTSGDMLVAKLEEIAATP